MIPLTILYDEYIDRPSLTEQKKPSWVYSSSLPTKVGVGTITCETQVGRITVSFNLNSLILPLSGIYQINLINTGIDCAEFAFADIKLILYAFLN